MLIFNLYHDQKAVNLMNRLQAANIDVIRCTQYTSSEETECSFKKSDFVFALLTDDAPMPRFLVEESDRIIGEQESRCISDHSTSGTAVALQKRRKQRKSVLD